MNPEQIVASLKALMEAGQTPGKVLTDAADLENYGKDWTKIYPPKPVAIVFCLLFSSYPADDLLLVALL